MDKELYLTTKNTGNSRTIAQSTGFVPVILPSAPIRYTLTSNESSVSTSSSLVSADLNRENSTVDDSNSGPFLPLVRSGRQYHINGGARTETILPRPGVILYKRRKIKNRNGKGSSSHAEEPLILVVVQVQTKARGANRGIADIVFFCSVKQIVADRVYYDQNIRPFVLKLTNHGKWFNAEHLKNFDFSWDDPFPSNSDPLVATTFQSDTPLAASSSGATQWISLPLTIPPMVITPLSGGNTSLLSIGYMNNGYSSQPLIMGSGRSWEPVSPINTLSMSASSMSSAPTLASGTPLYSAPSTVGARPPVLASTMISHDNVVIGSTTISSRPQTRSRSRTLISPGIVPYLAFPTSGRTSRESNTDTDVSYVSSINSGFEPVNLGGIQSHSGPAIRYSNGHSDGIAENRGSTVPSHLLIPGARRRRRLSLNE